MHKNNFYAIPNKSITYEDTIYMSQSTVYKIEKNENKKNNNIKRLKEGIFKKDFIQKNMSYIPVKKNYPKQIEKYTISKKILITKYVFSKKANYELNFINNIVCNKKCHILTIYNENNIYNNIKEHLKTYYKYKESKSIFHNFLI